MINIADQLHAATADGVLANASEIKDGTKTQSQINSEVQAALAQTGRIDDIRQIVRDAVGPGATADFESDEGLNVGNNILAYCDDGDWYIDTDHTTDLDDLEVGSVVKVTAIPSGEEFHVPASVDTSNLYIDSESHQIYGITGDPIPVQVGHTYRVAGIYATIIGDDTIYTYEEVADSVTDLVESITAKILDAIDEIRSVIQQECGESGSTKIDEDEIDAIINGVDTAAPYITFYSKSEGKTETAYRYTEGDVFYKDVSHTCFSRVDGQRFYLREGVWVDANGNASASYTGNLDVYASLTAELPIGTAEPHGFTF